MDMREYTRWLKLRRRRAWETASTLADRAARQGRPLSPAEKRDYDRLSDIVDGLDARIRVAAIEARRDDYTPRRESTVDGWARTDDVSYSQAPGSGDRGVLSAALRRQ